MEFVIDRNFTLKDLIDREFHVYQNEIIEISTLVRQEEILKQQTQPVKFSKHASMRLTQRNINLSDDQSMRLQKGIAAADSKGVNDSLVLVDDIAFIVNVPSKTVVTAMDQAETNSNVFTNIDGAVIM